MAIYKHQMIDAVEKAMRNAKIAHDEKTEKSWQLKVTRLSPADKVPPKGKFYDQAAKDAYNAKLMQYAADAEKAVSDYISGIHKVTVKVPSEEAVRAVQMFSMLDAGTITKEDYAQRVDDMMNQYGQDSAVTYETLRSMAMKAGIHDFKKHPDIVQRDAMQSVQRNVHNFFATRYVDSFSADNPIDDAAIAFTMMMIKQDAGVIKD
ncbi:MAG: hypothetical protein IKD66_01090 [Solobacterium sp.]|nr:hypothetical protein [Solobacterium sp.]